MRKFLILSGPLYLLFLTSVTLLLTLHTPAANAQPLYHICLDASNYTSNTTYEANLKLLFPALSSNASLNHGFYNTTIGQDQNRVYGLVLCRGDTGSNACRDCINTAGDAIVGLCPNNRSAIIWYDNCLLRFSNRSFFGSTENAPRFYMWNTQNLSQSDASRFNKIAADLMNKLASKAAYEPWNRMFATGEVNFASFISRINGLVQCVPYLSSLDCYGCLESCISEVPRRCDGLRGCRVVGPVCNIRFETYLFYGASVIAAAAPTPLVSPSPPPPSNNASSTEGNTRGSGNSSRLIAILISTIIVVVIIFIIVVILLTRKTFMGRTKTNTVVNDGITGSEESFQFDLDTIRAATNDFSNENKLGEGGFGPVYKGRLLDGQEIAVKRLAINSGQGVEEFRNEVALVAKLQHRNLVRIFGCCVEGKEKLLVYEYIPNRSLDTILFDQAKRGSLHWECRYKIIMGIARGLLYLHEDSRLRIIHRDLKASNVLLDADMNAKISDFGMAKIVGVDQTQGNTSRIVGTYGYMSPEYAFHGQFSVRSDVFSFGVLLLEIVMGQKNSSFYQSDHGQDLLSYAWRAWNSGTIAQMIDSTLRYNCSASEATRCIHIGLLCVQEDMTARPNMSSVVLMLNSSSVTLMAPSPPGYFIDSRMGASFQVLDHSMRGNNSAGVPLKSVPVSTNDGSISELEPR